MCTLCTFCQTARGSYYLCSLHFLLNSQRVSQFMLFALFVKQPEGPTICALCPFCKVVRGSRNLRSLHFLSNSQRVLLFALFVLFVKQSEGSPICAFWAFCKQQVPLCTFCHTSSESCGRTFWQWWFFSKHQQGLEICTLCTFCHLEAGPCSLHYFLFLSSGSRTFFTWSKYWTCMFFSQTARGPCNLGFLHFLSVGCTLALLAHSLPQWP